MSEGGNTRLRKRLPPPTDKRASAADGEGRAMAETKSVAEGGGMGTEYLGGKVNETGFRSDFQMGRRTKRVLWG